MDPMKRDRLQSVSLSASDVCDIVRFAPLFAVLDAAGAPAVPGMMIAAGDDSKALYMSHSDPELEMVAPYVVRLTTDRIAQIREHLWNDPWGILIEFDGDMMTLRRHLRQYLIVQSPEGRPLYFRFYDPRVLHTFVRSADKKSRAEFFGPMKALIARDTDPDAFVRYTLIESPAVAPSPAAFGL